MQYFEVVEDRRSGGHWEIHPVQCEGNIELEGALFFGPQGQQRAEDYARWMDSRAKQPNYDGRMPDRSLRSEAQGR